MLETLVYISSATKAYRMLDIKEILRSSRKNNMVAGITGVLIYGDCGFIQVLEGERHVLDNTYKRILCDPRHTGIMVLYREAVSQRNFPKWQMACHRLDYSDKAQGLFKLNPNNINELQLGEARSEVAQLLKSFIQVNFPHLAA